MAMNDFVPMSWNGEPISTDKLNQMCNNSQYLFDRSPRIRLVLPQATRDTGIKVITGKTAFAPDTSHDYVNVPVYFGSFFSSGCHPTVTATVEIVGGSWRKYVSIQGLTGAEIDQTGFMAQVVAKENTVTNIMQGGWVHWQAMGY